MVFCRLAFGGVLCSDLSPFSALMLETQKKFHYIMLKRRLLKRIAAPHCNSSLLWLDYYQLSFLVLEKNRSDAAEEG